MGKGAYTLPVSGENYHDQKNQSDSSERIIAPARAIGPGRKTTDQKKDEDD